MSVAFAAPRQRGKGEITPAAIQKVKPRGVGDARPILPLGAPPGAGPGVGRAGGEGGPAGGGGVWEPEPRAVPEWVAEGGEPVLPRSPSRVWALSYRHKSPSNRRRISLGMGRRSGGGARAPGGSGRAGKGCLSEPAPPAAPRVAPELLWRRPAQRAAAASCTPDLGSREAEGKSERGSPPSPALPTSADLGSSRENLGGRCYSLRGGRRRTLWTSGLPSEFPSPFRIHPLSVYIYSKYSWSACSGCSGYSGEPWSLPSWNLGV